MKNYTKYVEQLKELSDEDKIGYLVDLQMSEKLSDEFEIQIQIDNDSVYILFGYDKNDEAVGCYFDEFGYHLLPAIFNFLKLKSDFV